MPRRLRRGTAQLLFHAMNRVIEGGVLFENPEDYDAFLLILKEGVERYPGIRLLGYCLMPTHFHLVVWPNDDAALSQFLHWVTTTHAVRLRKFRGNTGRGAVYQSRFKAVPVQEGHFHRTMKYVERNASSKRLVERAEQWPWSSASPQAGRLDRPALTAWPVPKPDDWLEEVNVPLPSRDFEALRSAVRRDEPIGDEEWRKTMIRFCRLSGERPRGRPRKHPYAVVTKA